MDGCNNYDREDLFERHLAEAEREDRWEALFRFSDHGKCHMSTPRHQRTMFVEWIHSELTTPPTDHHVTSADTPRLTGQNASILERLKRGPATNRELAGISLKYTSRVSDLRAAGYRIQCEHGPGGLNTYTLEGV